MVDQTASEWVLRKMYPYCLCCTQYLKVLVNLVGTHFCVYALFWHEHHIPPMFLRTSAFMQVSQNAQEWHLPNKCME